MMFYSIQCKIKNLKVSDAEKPDFEKKIASLS